MPAKHAFKLSTVADLIKALSTLPADAIIYLSSDAEGNDWNPLDYLSREKGEDGRKIVTLIPMHGGWEADVQEKGGDA